MIVGDLFADGELFIAIIDRVSKLEQESAMFEIWIVRGVLV